MLAAVDVTKRFGDGDSTVHALRGITAEFAAATFTAIMGPSGSGKSTLLHCLSGLDTPSSGQVRLGDLNLSTLSDTELTVLRRTQLGFVFQDLNLLPALTAEQNIRLPAQLADLPAAQERIDEIVAVLRLGDRLAHRPHELSGGQRQRVALARALSTAPDVVFADEPTGNLDRRTGSELLVFLQAAVRELGQTVVMVTHDPWAASHADRVVFLSDGMVAGELLEPLVDDVLEGLRKLEEQ